MVIEGGKTILIDYVVDENKCEVHLLICII